MSQTINRNITLSRIGTDISKADSVPQALHICKGNYKVVLTPAYYQKGGQLVKAPDAQFTFALFENEKRSEFIATVGNRYTPLQNEDTMGICEQLAGVGGKYVRAYVSPNGGLINFRMQIAEERILDDIVMGFVDVNNSHDGTSAARAGISFEKLICKNGMTAVLDAVRITGRHTRSINNIGNRAKQAFDASNVGLKYLRQVAEDSAKIHISEQRWQGIVEQLLPFSEDPSTREKNLVEERRSLLYQAWKADDLANFRNTGWAAINAVTDYVTHLQGTKYDEERLVRRLLHNPEGDKMVKQAMALILN